MTETNPEELIHIPDSILTKARNLVKRGHLVGHPTYIDGYRVIKQGNFLLISPNLEEKKLGPAGHANYRIVVYHADDRYDEAIQGGKRALRPGTLAEEHPKALATLQFLQMESEGPHILTTAQAHIRKPESDAKKSEYVIDYADYKKLSKWWDPALIEASDITDRANRELVIPASTFLRHGDPNDRIFRLGKAAKKMAKICRIRGRKVVEHKNGKFTVHPKKRGRK